MRVHWEWIFIVLIGPVSAADSPTTVKVGLASNFSEISNTSVNPFLNNYRCAVQMSVRDNAPVLAKKHIVVETIELDYGTSNAATLEVAEKARRENIVAVLGFNNSREALLAAPSFQAVRIPMLSPTASATRLSKFGRYVHTMAVSNRRFAESMAAFARSRHWTRAWVITALDCPYCMDLSSEFSSIFQSNGGRIVQDTKVLAETDSELKSLIARKDLFGQIDFVVLPNYEIFVAKAIDFLVAAGFRGPFLGGDSFDNADGHILARMLKSSSVRGFFVSDWHPAVPEPKSLHFVKRFRKNCRTEPNDDAVLGYDTYSVFARSLYLAKKLDSEHLENALNTIQEFDGLLGRSLFRPNQAPERKVALVLFNGANGDRELVKWGK